MPDEGSTSEGSGWGEFWEGSRGLSGLGLCWVVGRELPHPGAVGQKDSTMRKIPV